MNVPDFYNPKDVEAFYSYDGDQYAVQEGNVFIRSGDKYVFTDSITLSQLELYAKKEELLSPLFELKVLAVKEHSDGSAFIKVTDNAGIDFTFIDSDYSKRRNNYVVGFFPWDYGWDGNVQSAGDTPLLLLRGAVRGG